MAICGNRVRITAVAKTDRRKGIAPLNMVPMGTSLAIPAIVYILSPTGGVMSPASIMSTRSTPNHMGSNPMVTTTGKMTGKVRTIMETESRKHPRRKYIATMITRMTYLDTPSPAIHVETAVGIVDRARK